MITVVSNDLYYDLAHDEVDKFMTPQAARFRQEDDKTSLESPVSINNSGNMESINYNNQQTDAAVPMFLEPATLDPVVLETWENDIIYEKDEDMQQSEEKLVSMSDSFKCATMFRNAYLEEDKWLNAIIYDENIPAEKMEFHMDDPNLVILENEVEEIKSNNICYDLCFRSCGKEDVVVVSEKT